MRSQAPALTGPAGFPEGLYSPAELDAASISARAQPRHPPRACRSDRCLALHAQERDAKVDFLNKLIRVCELASGEPLMNVVKANKIVAGQEPERTCQLLQALAQAGAALHRSAAASDLR